MPNIYWIFCTSLNDIIREKRENQQWQWKFFIFRARPEILQHLPYIASPSTRKQGGLVIRTTISVDLKALIWCDLPTLEISGASALYSLSSLPAKTNFFTSATGLSNTCPGTMLTAARKQIAPMLLKQQTPILMHKQKQ